MSRRHQTRAGSLDLTRTASTCRRQPGLGSHRPGPPADRPDHSASATSPRETAIRETLGGVPTASGGRDPARRPPGRPSRSTPTETTTRPNSATGRCDSSTGRALPTEPSPVRPIAASTCSCSTRDVSPRHRSSPDASHHIRPIYTDKSEPDGELPVTRTPADESANPPASNHCGAESTRVRL